MVKVGYKNISEISGPLIFVEGISDAGYNEMVTIETPSGEIKSGQVLDTRNGLAIVQVFGSTSGLDSNNTTVRFRGETARIKVSDEVLGRIFNGLGEPIDNGPQLLSKESVEIVGDAINPYSREEPSEFIQTGISTIDGMNTLVRGQKLPIFSGSGLPHNVLASQIARQAKTLKTGESFAVVFGAMGITSEEANFFMNEFRKTGALSRAAIFMNLSSDPSMERIILPRVALTTAEYLAYEREYHVLVILTDMTNYCESLREISSAREEVPGRRGYPGYMYTDLSTIYERAGKIRGRNGSITQLPILTMPGDDITNPIPDLTGYITEGQIVMSRELQRKGVYPPVDVLPSLSRLMNQGIGKGRTREDHRGVADQLYSAYATGKDLRSLSAIVGEESLSSSDKSYLKFADNFENKYVAQKLDEDRTIEDTLEISYDLLSELPETEMKRLKKDFIQKYGKWK
ncbi:V-type ATP synthase subunit B [Cuniculiplasma divulgatum]|uniref:A-type ATP synthase subunit B n=1 Tax=Cuniculiplasma divulgatum TaxID=1673428 RepID=A0A1N5S1G5_9ARCH|nr:V-type ATP synthase subunit B [Cuniculiplasma divulgatum]SIM29849.1 A-type Na(+),H(+)-transporting-ATP synthase subunit B [Cuniculiplasma divulgatum]